MDIVKIVAAALITALVSLIIKQVKPEYSTLIQITGITVITLLVISFIADLADTAGSLLNFAGLNGSYLKLLLKVLGIAVIVQFAADICRDSGNTALAGNVELAGKILILTMALPLVKAVAELASGLING